MKPSECITTHNKHRHSNTRVSSHQRRHFDTQFIFLNADKDRNTHPGRWNNRSNNIQQPSWWLIYELNPQGVLVSHIYMVIVATVCFPSQQQDCDGARSLRPGQEIRHCPRLVCVYVTCLDVSASTFLPPEDKRGATGGKKFWPKPWFIFPS